MKKKESGETEINNSLLRKTLERNPFLVPDNYFSALKEEIEFKKKIAELGDPSFIVPTTYQKTLKQDILTKISENELSTFIAKENPALAPDYFEDLQERILSKTSKATPYERVETHKEAKESLRETSRKRLGIYKWIPYMAAASIAVAIALFTIFDGSVTSNETSGNSFVQVEKIPTDEIIDYLAFYTEAGDLLYLSEQLNDRSLDITDNISTQEIEAYLEYSL
jgi:hypothetical protein